MGGKDLPNSGAKAGFAAETAVLDIIDATTNAAAPIQCFITNS
jgi:hypothetical protein